MIVFDTETTNLLMPEIADLSSQPYMIEVAVIKLGPKYKEVARYSTLLNPAVPLDEATHKSITGLTSADLADAPIFLEVYEKLAALFLGEDMLVAHNLSFDLGVLTTELKRIGKEFAFPYPPTQICTVESTKHLKGHRLKLVELHELKVGKKFKQAHRALSDVEALVRIIKEMKL